MRLLSRNLNTGANVQTAVPNREEIELLVNHLYQEHLCNNSFPELELGILIGLFIEKSIQIKKVHFFYYANFCTYQVKLVETTDLFVKDEYSWKFSHSSAGEFAIEMSKCKFIEKIK